MVEPPHHGEPLRRAGGRALPRFAEPAGRARLLRAHHERRPSVPAGGHRSGAAVLPAGRLRAVAVLEALPSGHLRQRGRCAAHGGRAAEHAHSLGAAAALSRVRRADGHEPAHRRDVRRGRRLACGPRTLRGVRGGARGRPPPSARAGLGGNTPGIGQVPVSGGWPPATRRAFYACVNRGEAYAPRELGARALALDADIGAVLRDLCMLRGPQAAGR